MLSFTINEKGRSVFCKPKICNRNLVHPIISNLLDSGNNLSRLLIQKKNPLSRSISSFVVVIFMSDYEVCNKNLVHSISSNNLLILVTT